MLLLAILALSGFTTAANAEDVAAPAPTADDALKIFPSLNLQGDTAYLITKKSLAVGVGVDLATIYDGMITLRAEAIVPEKAADAETTTMFGIGPMLNIPKLITRAGGEWTAKIFNPSIGVMPFYDFRTKAYDVGVVVSIIRVEF